MQPSDYKIQNSAPMHNLLPTRRTETVHVLERSLSTKLQSSEHSASRIVANAFLITTSIYFFLFFPVSTILVQSVCTQISIKYHTDFSHQSTLCENGFFVPTAVAETPSVTL